MEIIFFGTSSGIPTKSRNVSGLAVKRKNAKSWYLVDCGEGTQQQILHTRLSLLKLQAILITHMHGDHCYGLPGLLASAAMAGRSRALTVIGPAAIKDFVTYSLNITNSRLSYEITFIAVENLKNDFELADFKLEVVPLSHRVPCFAYAFLEKYSPSQLDVDKLKAAGIKPGPIWGHLQKGLDTLYEGQILKAHDYQLAPKKRRKIIIAGDNDKPELLADCAKSAEALIHEATYSSDVAAKLGGAYQHSHAKSVAQFAARVGLQNLVLTHFSPRYSDKTSATPSIKTIELEAKSVYQGNLFLARDLEVYYLDGDSALIKQVSSKRRR
ncbi:ribonuclease Z [Candidatus Venteria ishoeyi]|uniref:Ribonuclease Z n=1 Tax=Candidatus Venteria ishoeyi TaxID=1899563 RepID=A0A1H6FIB7_9GAMM|nr:ribonuclease Z [Candidatus Venteria ishoeyi]SEH09171.1 Ribonuclease Z [Candidatus Venteria ishoeyi]SEH09300.1 Ribonuclease Z [Candidatus Venteria ishoeyi]